MNWDYVRVKKTKRKIKINKQKGNKQTKIKKQINPESELNTHSRNV
jgi:hypothetical protein